MSLADAPRLALVFLLTGCATALFAFVAPRIGWTDAPRPEDAARKRQRRAVPAVGGAALLVGLAAAPWPAGPCADGLFGEPGPARAWVLATLAAVFAVGTVDDRVGLGPLAKAGAMFLAFLPLAVAVAASEAPPALLLGAAALVAGLVVINALNLFDNADGALALLCAVGFAPVWPFVSAACLGFLPLNLDSARAQNRASGAPTAYLGDAGAFVLGFLVLLVPRAAGVLVLPLLDVLRLSVVRLSAGSRPWIGDRRHLAHRLEARGLAPYLVAAVQAVIALPACALVPGALEGADGGRALLGVGATTALFLLALLATRAPVPCPPAEAAE